MTKKAFFPTPDPKKSISESEKEILKFWKDQKIFERSLEERSVHNEFVFFDGPPFATGTPHYGHILAGTLKDAIPRYKTMQGYRVERKWGWDCHGVPVEFQVEKENKIGGKPGIEKMGVSKFNELCRSIVLRCADQWEETVDRMGRFVDFKDDYKTMDPKFMESVWWVFGELWKKGLIYEGEKIVQYSPKLGSPLSNFEANLNYKDIDDPALTVKFELVDEPGTFLLAWTTTPWTLPSNLALMVHPDMEYVKVKIPDQEKFPNGRDAKGVPQYESIILLKSVFEKAKNKNHVLYSKIGTHFEYSPEAPKELPAFQEFLDETIKGKDLVGKKYTPLFPFFKDHENAFRVLSDEFVSAEEGTGIVHSAPNFGEDDARVCLAHGIKPLKNPIDENGYFDAPNIGELRGKYFRYDPEVVDSDDNANAWVIEELKKSGKIFRREQVRHSYPHCWRTDCALMYRGIKTWFVDIQKIKPQLLAENKKINWIPDHLRDGRFGKLLEGAPDWAISRNRYWGAPLPVWRCAHCGEIEVMGSRADLEKKCGKKVPDLHKHFVDELTWPCAKCKKEKMHRIPEVLDCWFESGAMPYASQHYPFAEGAKKDFVSADFIAEGLDQTRGWFYTLHVLGVALFGKSIYKNVITNGIVLAEDGQKMSKSKKNYPDPNLIFEKYGADALRFYLLDSPVVRGENLRVSEHGIGEVLKSVILPLRSAYQFFSTYANIDGWEPTKLIFLRHGEAEQNVQNVYSGNVKVVHHLTETGKKQVKAAAKKIPHFDELYTSPFTRAQETAELLKKETKFSGEIHTDARLSEAGFGNQEGKPVGSLLHRFDDSSMETLSHICTRGADFCEEVVKKHPGKVIAIVAHGDVYRSLSAWAMTMPHKLDTWLHLHLPDYATTRVYLPPRRGGTELDNWILSELQTLLQAYRKNFDAYDLEGALREIPAFVDKLNNWYLRRSRDRFWANGMSDEKKFGYETLHYVLFTLSKILAPVCPFFAEELFQNLGGGESVHLTILPFADEKLMDQKLQDKMQVSREIVRLAASIRSRKKIKLRQPLRKLQFIVVGNAKLDLDVIAAEANVKEVEILKDLKGVAQKTIKIDARMVGKKFGKKVQEMIQAGKEGNYKEGKDGTIEILGETLSVGEYESTFLCAQGVEAEATSQVVVLLDTEISDELKLEGFARDLIRAVQDLRKSEGLHVSDRIELHYSTSSELLRQTFTQFGSMISGEVLATKLSEDAKLKGAAQDFEGESIILSVKKSAAKQ